jgi:transposase
MIPVPTGVQIWIATGQCDMRKGMSSLALMVQQVFQRDPHAGDLYLFRGRRADLIKILWHDGIGMSLYAKRLERGRFTWPSAVDGVVAISASQMACLLEGIEWRNPQKTWRPTLAG